MDTVVENVACTVCGCVCDDLRLTVSGRRITKAEGACKLSEPWLLAQGERRPPAAVVGGEIVPTPTAIRAAAELLARARNPLVYGLSRSSTEGQQAALALAETLGANVDTTASRGHAPSIIALQEVGESTCSLGEVKNRADLVVFWGSDPVESHPRHGERYSMAATGKWVPAGRRDRTVVVVDVRPTATSADADVFLRVTPGSDFEILWTMRALLAGHAPSAAEVHGVRVEVLAELVERMKRCRFGIVFFGLGLARSGVGHRTVEALLRLTTELNAFTRFYARRMRVSGDVAGADSVLAWQTGFPFSVNLGRGYPRYNPGEFSAQGMLERGEIDACLLVGSQGLRRLSPRALAALREVPTVVLDGPLAEPLIDPAVRFTTDVYGVHRPGVVYRMDEIPIPLRAVLPSEYPSDREVLDAIHSAIRGREPGSLPG